MKQDLSFFGRQVKLFEVDLDFFLKFSQLVTNYLVSLLKTSPLKEDRSRRLVATNLFSKEDYLLICDWWKICRLFWLALAKINRIPYKMKILTQEHHSSIFGMNLTLFCVPILLFKLFFWISEKNCFGFHYPIRI